MSELPSRCSVAGGGRLVAYVRQIHSENNVGRKQHLPRFPQCEEGLTRDEQPDDVELKRKLRLTSCVHG